MSAPSAKHEEQEIQGVLQGQGQGQCIQPSQEQRLFFLDNILSVNNTKNDTITAAAFSECGRRKVLGVIIGDQLHIIVWNNGLKDTWCITLDTHNSNSNSNNTNTPWSLCIEPAGWWIILYIGEGAGLIAIPTVKPGDDTTSSLSPPPCAKWPFTGIATLPHPQILLPTATESDTVSETNSIITSLSWWQTDDSRHFIIIGDQRGDILFYSLDSYSVVAKTCIVGGIRDLMIYTDDSLDEITLLITSVKSRQWRLVLEKRSIRYDWLTGKREKGKMKEFNKKIDSFISSVREYGGDKMSNLFQMKSKSASDVRSKLASSASTATCSNVPSTKNINPSPITFEFLEDSVTSNDSENTEANIVSNRVRWFVAPQTANGRHFVSIYSPSRGILMLQNSLDGNKYFLKHSVENPTTDLHLIICKQNVFYTISSKCISLRSSYLASQRDTPAYTTIWEDDLDDSEDVLTAFGVDEFPEFPPYQQNWTDTKDVSQLDLPRFKVDSCLIVTNKNVYQLTTRSDPCEWLVNQLVLGNKGVERFAAALSIDLQPLLIAAADILLARRNISKALSLYRLAKVSLDESLIRMGALGYFNDIVSGVFPRSNSASDICFIAYTLQSLVLNDTQIIINYIHNNAHFSIPECLQLCVELGLWDAVMTICFVKGVFSEVFDALMNRIKSPCRGLLATFLQKPFTHFIITDSALPLLKYIEHYCESFDTHLLKEICIWICPLQDSLHTILHALITSQPNEHLGGMRRLVRTFFGVMSTLHARLVPKLLKTNENNNEQQSTLTPAILETDAVTPSPNTNVMSYLSCGLSHWGITNRKNICLTSDKSTEFVNVDSQILGNILSVACGRSHTLILSENGLYGLGENGFGQLGIGKDILYTGNHPVLVSIVESFIPTDSTSTTSPFWGNEAIAQISAGQYHSACVTGSGTLYTWGWAVHGQLGHGYVTNEYYPRKVKFFNQKEKVKYVGCGACHTVMLTESGFIYLCGNGAFGQIGNSERQKCNIPTKVHLNEIVIEIAVGYYHTLARTKDGVIWVWGSSPQSLRFSAKGLSNSAQSENSHLQPTVLNLSNVKGSVAKMSAGCHHSCILDSGGNVYIWGLNLDGQLGSGDQKEILIPTMIDKWGPNGDTIDNMTIIDVCCGGDFTLLFTSDYKLMISGNSNQLFQHAKAENICRIVTLKNTKRTLRLPNRRRIQKYFCYVMLPNSFSNIYKDYLEINCNHRLSNPIKTLADFDSPDWATNALSNLHQFVDDDTPLVDIWLRAKLANLRKDFSEELNLRLNSLFVDVNSSSSSCSMYLQHTNNDDSNNKFEVIKTMIENLKNLSRNVIDKNHKSTDPIGDLYCQCIEDSYLIDENCEKLLEPQKIDVEVAASSILRSMFNILPHDSNIWSDCVGQATSFWIQHELNMSVLEKVLCEVMINGNATDMASAIFCSNNNVDYQKFLSTGFNLDMCENILQFL